MARDIAQEAQRTAEMASQVRDLSLGYTLNQILGNKSEVQINPVWDFVFFEIFFFQKVNIEGYCSNDRYNTSTLIITN